MLDHAHAPAPLAMSAGKGDTPRPVKGETYRENWTAIFGKPKPKPKKKPRKISRKALSDLAFGMYGIR